MNRGGMRGVRQEMRMRLRHSSSLTHRRSRRSRTLPTLVLLALAALIWLAGRRAFAEAPLIATSRSSAEGSPAPIHRQRRESAEPPIFAASTTAAAHRIALPSGPRVQLRLSTFEATIELRTRNGAPLPTRLPLLSTPCHPIDSARGDSLLQCDNGRIDAQISEVNGRRYLDLRELRGLPTNDGEEGPPHTAYPPEQLGLGAACPGDTAAARGECAFEKGENAEAHTWLTQALSDIETHRFAALRLGDLALRRRDPDSALALYSLAGNQGIWGRLATERICELTGTCFSDPSLEAYDTVGLPAQLASELNLRKLRALALLGRWNESMEALSGILEDSPASCMGDTKMLCRRLVLAAMRLPACPPEIALSAYLRLPMFLSGPLASELARAAGEDASELGAPAYGATLLAATTRLTPRDEMLAHAQEAIALYQAAGDPFRAHVMWSWANDRLSAKEARALPPDTIAFASPSTQKLSETLSADLDNDESAASLAIVRATLMRAKLAAPQGRRR